MEGPPVILALLLKQLTKNVFGTSINIGHILYFGILVADVVVVNGRELLKLSFCLGEVSIGLCLYPWGRGYSPHKLYTRYVRHERVWLCDIFF